MVLEDGKDGFAFIRARLLLVSSNLILNQVYAEERSFNHKCLQITPWGRRTRPRCTSTQELCDQAEVDKDQRNRIKETLSRHQDILEKGVAVIGGSKTPIHLATEKDCTRSFSSGLFLTCPEFFLWGRIRWPMNPGSERVSPASWVVLNSHGRGFAGNRALTFPGLSIASAPVVGEWRYQCFVTRSHTCHREPYLDSLLRTYFACQLSEERGWNIMELGYLVRICKSLLF